ncbi:hypothetical protein [Azospirillum sp. TSO22-1]|uniref:hypothetical protein n=1 Tax=Azospirillum sp. TSO22-1 TaxID=716789 RepID=UPI000D622DF6|nr:hypothetical protein [Azospirillum sp. TSO22-1]PWC53136.1 hypothetical protein TSO221_11425 [Azospirillum sp. TSO22-1]
MVCDLDMQPDMAQKADRKVTMLITEDELREIEDAWHEDRMRSRNEAIRDLLRRGIDARKKERIASKA